MALAALVVCADTQALQVLTSILENLDVTVECCADVHSAAGRIHDSRFDAVLVDCKDEAETSSFIDHLRETSTNKETIVIAMVDGSNSIRELFDRGVNFILYKPVSEERVRNSMRAAHTLMQRERRSGRRVPVRTKASISYADVENAATSLIDLGEAGVAIQTGRQFAPRCRIFFEFSLPEMRSVVRLSGEVLWQDSTGRVGIRFLTVPQSSQRVLKGWLQENLAKHAEVPPDLEISDLKAEDPIVTLTASLGLLSVSSADRRDRSRRQCSLSAEVYRSDHAVPNRCRLSDVGPGGCYVETPLPFPSATELEIVVRTLEQKIHVYGEVRSTHPGYGMGVRFNLDTPEQQEQIQKLIACAAAAEPEVAP